LHHMVPAILTCVVRKKFGLDPEYHWRIRDSAARVLAKICDRFGMEYNTLQPRVIKTLLSALIDQTKSLSTHYGCIVALGALGREVIKTILVPNLKTYSEILEQRKKLDKNKAERCENTIMDILPKLKGSSIPMDESQMSDEELQQKLEDKIGAQFAKQVMDKIEDREGKSITIFLANQLPRYLEYFLKRLTLE
ncbi:23774_t:CDS:2, partial [Racocetra persica]